MNDMRPENTTASPIAIDCLFFISGSTSLVYQTIWFRRFTTLWGNSTLAMAAVVCAFLIGLAVGAYIMGRVAHRVLALKWYGTFEITIGIWGLLVPWVLLRIPDGSIGLSHSLCDLLVSFLMRTLLAFIAIGVPTLCMGGTLPLLVEYWSKAHGSLRHRTGVLYGVNTLGATTGCYLAGFHLLPAFGSQMTTLTASICNIVLGIVALLIARAESQKGANRLVIDRGLISTTSAYRRRGNLLFVASALTGCAALLLEMVWTRQLALIVGGSTYTFTATLCVVLLGIGIGGVLYHTLERFMPLRYLLETRVLTIVLICLTTAVSQSFIPHLCLISGALRLFRDSDLGNGIVCALMAAVLELLPAIGMGLLFPALVHAGDPAGRNVGNVVGRLYLWNTIGAAVGAILAFSLFVPLVGSAGTLAIAVGIYLGASLLLELDAGMFSMPRVFGKAILGAVLVTWLVQSTSPLRSNLGMYLYGPNFNPALHDKVLYFGEGTSCNVLVTESPRGRVLRVNGKTDASTGADQNMQLGCAYLTRFLRPHAKHVGVIGLGSGQTAGASLLFPQTFVTCFELEPAVYHGAKCFADINHSPWESNRFTIVFDDARRALNRSDTKYDVIISEPSNPWIAGVSSLYTLEFYRTAHLRLNKGGILAQWVQSYDFTLNEFGLIVRTMQVVFPNVALIRINDSDTILIASEYELSPTSGDLDTSQHIVDSVQEIAQDLTVYFGTHDVRSLLLRHFVLNERGLNRLDRDDGQGVINTDFNMRLEFDAPRQLFRRRVSDDDNIALAINRVITTEWPETCIHRWKCSRNQAEALADLLVNITKYRGNAEVQRMVALCRGVDPAEPFFQIMERIASRTSEGRMDDAAAMPVSNKMLERLGHVGVNFWRKKDYEQAAIVFHEVVAVKPESATSWMNLSINYERLGKKELAAEAAERAIAIDPLNSFAQNVGKRFQQISLDSGVAKE